MSFPSEVRHQTESFAVAFAEHEKKYKDDVEGMQKVKGWRTALSAAADLKGCNVHDSNEYHWSRGCCQQIRDSSSCNDTVRSAQLSVFNYI
uniref:Uncharacterized protein n=1 Tax=Solanum tuberosum TaxID=4113 RepID=M1AKT6_SOLTU